MPSMVCWPLSFVRVSWWCAPVGGLDAWTAVGVVGVQGGSGVCPGEDVLVCLLVSEQLLLAGASRSPPASLLLHAVCSAPHSQAAAARAHRITLLPSPCRVWWTSCCPRWTSGSATCCACATACWGEQTAGGLERSGSV